MLKRSGSREPPMQWPTGWRVRDDGKRVGIRIETKNFLDALDLFREVGEAAEALEHHPDLHLESWNKVHIETYSHDAGRLTSRDEALAARIHDILKRRGLVD